MALLAAAPHGARESSDSLLRDTEFENALHLLQVQVADMAARAASCTAHARESEAAAEIQQVADILRAGGPAFRPADKAAPSTEGIMSLQQPRVMQLGERVFTYVPRGSYTAEAEFAAAQYVPTTASLIETPGSIANLCRVMDAVQAGTPILLEGSTGVG